jgi:hypothetical protein
VSLRQPKGAADATYSANSARRRYQTAVLSIQTDRSLSEKDRKTRLRMLHEQHKQHMDRLRIQRQRAFRDAEQDALRRLMQSELAHKHTLAMDSYRRRVEELHGRTTEELAHAFDLAELMDDPIGMQAVAVHALQRRMPGVPGDANTRLVARFATARWPNGDWMFPKASIGWETLLELEEWTRTDHMAAEGVFSVPDTPESRTHPHQPTP